MSIHLDDGDDDGAGEMTAVGMAVEAGREAG